MVVGALPSAALEPEAELWVEGLGSQDGFARQLTIEGSNLFVGASSRDEPGENAGGVFVFGVADGGEERWTLRQELRAQDTAPGDGFGSAVDIEDGLLVVGAFLASLRQAEDDLIPVVEAGSAEWSRHTEVDGCGMVYLFRDSVSGWEEEGRLASPEPKKGDLFGLAVAISGDTVAVGAPGVSKTFVFAREGLGWGLQARLEPAETMANRRLGFGRAVAISGDVVVVGDPDADDSHGAAEVFRREGGVWRREQRLEHPSPRLADGLGFGVAVDGRHLLLGAPKVDDIAFESGRVFSFEFRDGIWNPTGAFGGGVENRLDSFGREIRLRGSRALIASSGAAYLFSRHSGSWVLLRKLEPEDEARSGFGRSVGLDGQRVAVGAGGCRRGDRNPGCAFVYALGAEP